jgi:hypothetical protein
MTEPALARPPLREHWLAIAEYLALSGPTRPRLVREAVGLSNRRMKFQTRTMIQAGLITITQGEADLTTKGFARLQETLADDQTPH